MKFNLRTLFLTAISIGGLCAAAQVVVTPPAAHRSEHSDLIAGQINVGSKIKTEASKALMDQLFPEEEEPEADIYEEGWGSQAVNCYAGMTVGNNVVIDLRGFHMPTKRSYVTSPYGYRRRFRRMHKGTDLKVQVGDTIYAAFDGKVRIVRNQGRRKGYGMYIVVRHNNNLETVYGHLSKWLVEPNEYVTAGTPIGLGGNTGRSTGPHLHFETRYMGYAINPQAIFDFANHTTHTDTYTFTKATYMNARDFAPDQSFYAKYDDAAPREKTRATSASGSKYYTVRRGDTLSRIASRNGTKVSKICRLNGISTSSTLKIGSKLRIK